MSAQARIPHADDEPVIIEYSTPLPDRSGFDVKTSTNGEKALLKIIIYAPNSIPGDVLMPKIVGRKRLADYVWQFEVRPSLPPA